MSALTRIRLTAVLSITCAVMLGALSFAGSASAATIASASCQASGYAQIDGKCMQIAHTKTLSPAASAALKKAFATPAGRAALRKAFRAISGAKAGLVQTPAEPPASAAPPVMPLHAQPAWNCPGNTSCGVSSSGGWHFWFIASYAAIFSVGATPFWRACTGALSPIIDPIAATAACGAVTAIIWALVNNHPWTTQHGVWMAVYWNHITDGYW